ncbi:putative heterokaryon incompatibility protein [Botryosphaeria dothidea]|uniref:Heterokaryon incompatibility protein n=1 Tax=Botryosphaeria dothidea TaxID=55169 RepID=A0A8H4IIC7_9PEZI|nr:putative heterokaryon incompatibility protein [Botryosphaeria dothidea]
MPLRNRTDNNRPSKKFNPDNYQVIPSSAWPGFFVNGKKQQPDQETRRIFQRFVILKAGTLISKCLQIKTYEGKATTRRDIRDKQNEHAVVYMGINPPNELAGETGLQEPIQADAESRETWLSDKARINYGQIFDIDHNTKVYAIGKVTEACIPVMRRTHARVHGYQLPPEIVEPTTAPVSEAANTMNTPIPEMTGPKGLDVVQPGTSTSGRSSFDDFTDHSALSDVDSIGPPPSYDSIDRHDRSDW